jgi:hypothetical protein
LGVLAMLGWLRTPARRVLAAAVARQRREDRPDWRLLVGTDRAKPLPHLTSGLLVLICADVIRPSLGWPLRFAPARHNLASEMARPRDPAVFVELSALCEGRVGLQCQQRALTNVAIIMAVKGGNVAAVRVVGGSLPGHRQRRLPQEGPTAGYTQSAIAQEFSHSTPI